MGSPDCLELTDNLRRLPGSDVLIKLLIQQIKDFDFEQALDTLTGLERKWEES